MKNTTKQFFTLVLAALLAFSLTSCNNPEFSGETDTEINNDSPKDSSNDGDMFTERDGNFQYNESGCVKISLNNNSSSCDSSGVSIDGETVTINEDGTYLLEGQLDDGMIIVNAPSTAKMQLILNGVNISNNSSASIYVRSANKVFITLADGSENVLSNGGSFTNIDENNIDSVVFSKQDLSINGSGSLTIKSPAGHGITAKDDLVMFGGTYDITAASHGIDVNDSVRIKSADIGIHSGKDGIHCENKDDISRGYIYVSSGKFNIESKGDGISASSYIQIENGDFNILAGNEQSNAENSSSMKGFKAQGGILINNGNITVNAFEDAIKTQDKIVISGGAFVGTGAKEYNQSFTNSSQGIIALTVEEQPKNTLIKLCDSKGNIILEHSPLCRFSTVILSSHKMNKGESYTVYIGSLSGEFTAE